MVKTRLTKLYCSRTMLWKAHVVAGGNHQLRFHSFMHICAASRYFFKMFPSQKSPEAAQGVLNIFNQPEPQILLPETAADAGVPVVPVKGGEEGFGCDTEGEAHLWDFYVMVLQAPCWQDLPKLNHWCATAVLFRHSLIRSDLFHLNSFLWKKNLQTNRKTNSSGAAPGHPLVAPAHEGYGGSPVSPASSASRASRASAKGGRLGNGETLDLGGVMLKKHLMCKRNVLHDSMNYRGMYM